MSKLKEVSKYEPLNSWLIVKTETIKETKEGFTFTADAKNRGTFENATGIILKLGNSLHKEYSHLKVGDEVRYLEHRGEAVAQDDDYLYRAIQDVDIYLRTKKGKEDE
jgi:co-chaperonin GroES (HSP10)